MEGVDLIWGLDYQEDVANGVEDNQGAFVELLSDLSQTFYLTWLRYDDNETRTNTSFRLSTAYLLETGAGTLKFKVNSELSRAPSRLKSI